jgi:hypothetical protein
MRWSSWFRYTMESLGPDSRAWAHPAALTFETEPRAPAVPVSDPPEPDSPHWWSAWIELGGEG